MLIDLTTFFCFVKSVWVILIHLMPFDPDTNPSFRNTCLPIAQFDRQVQTFLDSKTEQRRGLKQAIKVSKIIILRLFLTIFPRVDARIVAKYKLGFTGDWAIVLHLIRIYNKPRNTCF